MDKTGWPNRAATFQRDIERERERERESGTRETGREEPDSERQSDFATPLRIASNEKEPFAFASARVVGLLSCCYGTVTIARG